MSVSSGFRERVPGVAIVATSGEQKIATSTDENGAYRLDLPPGQWTIQAELFAFQKQSKTITQADATTRAEWDMRFLAGPTTPAARRGFQAAQLERTSELPQVEAPALSVPIDEGAGESFLVAGSVSQGLQRPDAQDAPGGFYPGMMMDRPFGGPGDAQGQSGANPFASASDTQGAGQPQQGQGPGGPRGPGGPGGGPGPGGRPGFGGGGGFGGGAASAAGTWRRPWGRRCSRTGWNGS